MNIKKIKTAVKHSVGTVSSDANVIGGEVEKAAKTTLRKSGGLSGIVGKTNRLVNKQAPNILTAAGVGAVVVSGVLIARASTNLTTTLDDHKKFRADVEWLWDECQKPNPDEAAKTYTRAKYINDKTIAYRNVTIELVKLYALPVAVGVAGIGSILAAQKILKNRQAAALAAAAVITESFAKYRSNVADTFGAEVEEKIYQGHQVKVSSEGKVKVSKTSDTTLDARVRVLFDQVNAPSAFEHAPGLNYIRINATQNVVNNRLQVRGHVFLNEVFDDLGLPRTQEGAVMGWSLDMNPDSYIDFGLGNTNDPGVLAFVNQEETAVWLAFNCDGLIWDQI